MEALDMICTAHGTIVMAACNLRNRSAGDSLWAMHLFAIRATMNRLPLSLLTQSSAGHVPSDQA
jgi:hypothetical protein